MTADLKPYPAYKDSGVPWLGEVPEHWEVRRLRNLAEMRVSNVDKHSKEGELPVRLCNYVDVYKNDYIRPCMRLMQATATRDEIERFRLAVGDVLITKDSEAWNDIGVPALVRETASDLVCGYHLALLRPFERRLSGEYLLRALQSNAAQYQFHVEANGVTRYGLSHAAIKSVSLPVPPLPEQAAIVRFLDYVDRRIRRYIRAKQKLIKLLEELKAAIIHRAVTRGLDPNVRLKPSGVEWLGDVPEHWKIERLKRLARPGRKGFTDGDWIELPYITDTGIRLIQTGNVGPGEYREKGFRYVSEETFAALGCTEVQAGDVLICRLDGPVGRACLAPDLGFKSITSVDNTILKVRLDLDARFVVYCLTSPVWLDWVQSLCRAGGGFRYRVSRSALGNFQIAVPSLTEQNQISEQLDQDLRANRAAVQRARASIDLLSELRTRLIADVVSGKLDVREAATRLPDEVEETEPLDEIDALTDAEDATGDHLDAAPDEANA